MTRLSKHLAVSRYPAPLNSAEVGGVVAGLLAGAAFTFLILLFAAGFDLFNASFKPIVVTLYVATFVTALTLLILRRGAAALIAAWLPVILLVVGTQVINVAAWFN